MNNIQNVKLEQLRIYDNVLSGNIDQFILDIDKDYTSFEVYPHNTTIEAGSVDEDTELEYKVEVPANMYLALHFSTYKQVQSELDITIDLGDGHVIALADLPAYSDDTAESLENDDAPYILNFKYWSDPYNYSQFNFVYRYAEPGKKIVRIYGKDYFMVRCGSSNIKRIDIDSDTVITCQPIISRIFDTDLRIASNLTNTSSICNSSNMIQKLVIPYEYSFKNMANISHAFGNCKNLVYASCSDGIIDRKIQSFNGMFNGCSNLVSDVLLLKNFFKGGSEDMLYNNLFESSGVSCSNYDKLADTFWGNPLVQIKQSSNTFTDCVNLDRSRIPSGWGGTAQTDNYMGTVAQSISQQTNLNSLMEICLKQCMGNNQMLVRTLSAGYEFITPESNPEMIKYQQRNTIGSLETLTQLLEVKTVNSDVSAIALFGLAKCTSLTSFDGSNGNIEVVKPGAFYGDNALIQVRGFKNVAMLERNIFVGCRRLSQIDDNVFPEVTAYNNNNQKIPVFRNCDSLTSISFPKLDVTGILYNLPNLSIDCFLFGDSAFKRIELPMVTQEDYNANVQNWAGYIPSGCSVILSGDITVVKN